MFVARVPTMICQRRGQLPAAGWPPPPGWAGQAAGDRRDPSSHQPLSLKDPAPTGPDVQKRKGTLFESVSTFRQKPGCIWDEPPAALPGSPTPGNQALLRAPRLQDQADKRNLGLDVALGRREAQETVAGWRSLAKPRPAQLWRPAQGLRGRTGLARPGCWAQAAGGTLPMGGWAEEQPSEPQPGGPERDEAQPPVASGLGLRRSLHPRLYSETFVGED